MEDGLPKEGSADQFGEAFDLLAKVSHSQIREMIARIGANPGSATPEEVRIVCAYAMLHLPGPTNTRST